MKDEQNAPTSTPEQALEAKVSAGLDALIAAHDGEPAPTDAVDTAGSTAGAAEEATIAEETGDEAEGTEEGQSEAGDTEGQQPESPAPTVPAAHIRSLKAYEWTDDEIAAAHQANPASFAATAAKLHKTRTDEIKRWADLGRQQKTPTPAGAPAAAPAAAQPPAQGVPALLDVNAMIQKYGSEDIVREIVGPVNAVLQQIHGFLPALQQNQAALEQDRMSATKQHIDSFFVSKELTPYVEAYGASPDTMTPQQETNRVAVLRMADNIRSGAMLRGEILSIQDALSHAHEIVGGQFKTQAVRQQIKGQVKAQSRGITQRASTTTGRPTSAAGLSPAAAAEAELESKTRARLAALG